MRGRRWVAPVLSSVVLVGSSTFVHAETLQDAWQRALQHNRALAAASADVEAAKSNERAARATRLPSLDATGAYTQFATAPAFELSSPTFAFHSAPVFSNDDYVTGGAQVKLPLYTGGQISAGIQAASHVLTGARENKQVTISSLKLDVAKAYTDVLRARRALRVAESSVTSLAAHVNDVQRMVEGELVPTSDLLAARVALANAEQSRVRAENGVNIAQAAYNRRIGEPLDRAPDLDEHLPADASVAESPVETLIQRALDSRGELKGLMARADALGAQARAERASLLPQVALTGGYTYFENEFLDRDSFSIIGVGMTWSLFDGGQARNRAAALRNAGRAAQHRVEDLRSIIELEVRTAWLDMRAAQARVKASTEAVGQAEENLRLTRELYGAELGTNTQVLDAVVLHIAAVNNRDDGTLDERLAHLQLARAIGAL